MLRSGSDLRGTSARSPNPSALPCLTLTRNPNPLPLTPSSNQAPALSVVRPARLRARALVGYAGYHPRALVRLAVQPAPALRVSVRAATVYCAACARAHTRPFACLFCMYLYHFG